MKSKCIFRHGILLWVEAVYTLLVLVQNQCWLQIFGEWATRFAAPLAPEVANTDCRAPDDMMLLVILIAQRMNTNVCCYVEPRHHHEPSLDKPSAFGGQY